MRSMGTRNPLGTATWRQLLRAHAGGFLDWLDSTGKCFEVFDHLAAALEMLLLDQVLADGPEISAAEAGTRFAHVLPLVLSKCDEPIYDEPFVAEAYAFVHLLERYRRFSQVLDALLTDGILPMRDSGIDVLDVGVGPGPALFATSDFYDQLNQYARVHRIEGLKTPPPGLHSVESSFRMVRVMHWISELSGRRHPFDRDLTDFIGVDFEHLRSSRRDATIESLGTEDMTWETLSRLSAWKTTGDSILESSAIS
jgi:hypothetical protein